MTSRILMGRPGWRERIGWGLGVLMYAVLASTWLSGLDAPLDFSRRLMSVTLAVYCMMNVGFMLTVTPPKIASTPAAQILVSLMMPMPFLTLLSGPQVSTLTPAGPWIASIGAVGMIVSLHYLGRSWAIVPGFRELTYRGPYRWVRHPVYSFYVPMIVGFGLTFFSPINAAVVVACIGSLGVVVWTEERALAGVPEYAAYRRRVRYRFVPGLL